MAICFNAQQAESFISDRVKTFEVDVNHKQPFGSDNYQLILAWFSPRCNRGMI